MLHICPRIPNQTFDELPFEEEILAFLRYLGYSGEIKKITDFNINKLHQPWRSFATVINKCLSGKITGYDSLRLSQAQILWGMYHKKNVDFAYLLHQNTQQFGAMLPVELTNKDIRNSAAYKEYYAIASGAAPPKMKASKSSDDDDDDDDDDDVDDQSDADDDDDNDDQEDEDEQDDDDQDDNDDDQESDNDGDDFVHLKLSTHDEEAKEEESFDPIVQTPSHMEDSDDESNDDESHGMNVGGNEGPNAEDDDEELYRDVNINLEGRDSSSVSSQFVTSMLNLRPDACIDSIFESTPWVDVPVTTTVVPLLVIAPTLPPPIMSQTLEDNFFEFIQANQFAEPVSSILRIIDRYIDHRMNEAVKVAVQLQSDRLRDDAQAENEDFINKLDENIQKIIKEQVKVQVSKILPKIEKTVNEKLESEVLTRSSNSSKTSYVMAVDLSELELKKILIEKMESNKDTVTLKRRCDDAEKDKEPSVGSDRGSKRRIEGKEPESTKEPIQTTQDLEEPSHQEFEIGAADDQPTAEASQHPECDLAKQADSHTSFNELMDTPVDFLAFLMNRLNVDTLTPELLAGLTYELMKGSCKSLVELELFLEEVYKATTDQLDWNNPEGQQYPHNLLKPLPLIPNSRVHHVIPFDHFINNDLEYLRGGAFIRKYTTSVTKTKVANYWHIKWIEDLVPRTMWSQAQGKLTNLTVEERFAFNVSLRMFTRSIVIQRHVEDL
nr:hypothetical protein [Tanacetum cinerariifolium]